MEKRRIRYTVEQEPHLTYWSPLCCSCVLGYLLQRLCWTRYCLLSYHYKKVNKSVLQHNWFHNSSFPIGSSHCKYLHTSQLLALQSWKCSAAPTKVDFQSAIDTSHKCVVFQTLKAIVTPQSLLVLDFRGLGLERWLVLDLASQLASQTHSLPFEFRALEAILQHKAR